MRKTQEEQTVINRVRVNQDVWELSISEVVAAVCEKYDIPRTASVHWKLEPIVERDYAGIGKLMGHDVVALRLVHRPLPENDDISCPYCGNPKGSAACQKSHP